MVDQAALHGLLFDESGLHGVGLCRDVRAAAARSYVGGVSDLGSLPGAGADRDAVAVPVKNRMRELRNMMGWSQAEIADMLDISRQSVIAVETGKFDPSLPLAFRIARLFGMKIEDVDPTAAVVEGAAQAEAAQPWVEQLAAALKRAEEIVDLRRRTRGSQKDVLRSHER